MAGEAGVVRLGLGLVASLVIARALGPADFGVYAVSVFHDENMNQKLDKNFVGVPNEGYGASNNPKKKMGPPNFDEAKFQLSGTEQSVEIKLMY